MTTQNNFDMSSSGVNIEVRAFYDTDRSSWDFREAFEEVKQGGYRSSSIWYYTDFGNIESHKLLDWTIKGTVKNLKDFLFREAGHYLYDSELRAMRKADLIESVLEAVARQYRLGLEDIAEIQDWLDTYNLVFTCGDELEKVSVRGYSQGDYAEVWVNKTQLQKAWGKAPDLRKLNEEFTHLFYDAPVFACVEVNGAEYHYHEYGLPEYSWFDGREKFIDGLVKDTGLEREQFETLLPENLSY